MSDALHQLIKFKCEITDGPDDMLVLGFRGRGCIHFGYSVFIDITSEHRFTPDRLVGKDAKLVITAGLGDLSNVKPIEIHGHIHWARTLGHRHVHFIYRVELTSNLRILERTKRYRLFEKMKVDEISREVLGNTLSKMQVDSDDMPLREICTQYGESDLNFVRRLLSEEGCYILNDYNNGNAIITEKGSNSRSRDAGSTVTVEQEIVETVHGVLGDTYDWLKPGASLEGGAGQNSNEYQEYYYRVDLIDDERGPGVDRQARINLDRLQSHGMVYRGITQESDVIEGYDCVVKGESMLVYEMEYEGFDPTALPRLPDQANGSANAAIPEDTISQQNTEELKHDSVGEVVERTSLKNSAASGGTESEKDRGYYKCRFSGIPVTQTYVPEIKVPKPTANGVITAVVESESDEEIDSDEHGRVRVRFPWDMESEKGSCRLRFASPWAGEGFGLVFAPRNGQEVCVGFEGGDIDRPYISSMFYNGVNAPPWSPTESGTKSGIRTRSVPVSETEMAYNELSFEDKAGEELIYLKAQRDLSETVGNDCSVAVGNNMDLDVTGAYILRVGGEGELAYAADKQLSVGANYGVNVGGDAQYYITGNRTDSIGGNLGQVTGGSSEEHILGNLTQVISGEVQEIIEATFNQRIKGAVVRYLEANLNEVVKGTFYHKVEGEVLEEFAAAVHQKFADNLKIQVEGEVLLDVGGGITFKCGGNILTVNDSASILAGSKVQLNSESAEVSAADVELEEPPIPSYGKLKVTSITCKPTSQISLGEDIVLTVSQLEKMVDDGESEEAQSVGFSSLEAHLQALVVVEYSYSDEKSPGEAAEWFAVENLDASNGNATITPPSDNERKKLHFRAYVSDPGESSCSADLQRNFYVKSVSGPASAKVGEWVTYAAEFNLEPSFSGELGTIRWCVTRMIQPFNKNKEPKEKVTDEMGFNEFSHTIDRNIVRGGLTTVRCYIEITDETGQSCTTTLDDNRKEN